jgi:hypothetical protein
MLSSVIHVSESYTRKKNKIPKMGQKLSCDNCGSLQDQLDKNVCGNSSKAGCQDRLVSGWCRECVVNHRANSHLEDCIYCGKSTTNVTNNFSHCASCGTAGMATGLIKCQCSRCVDFKLDNFISNQCFICNEKLGAATFNTRRVKDKMPPTSLLFGHHESTPTSQTSVFLCAPCAEYNSDVLIQIGDQTFQIATFTEFSDPTQCSHKRQQYIKERWMESRLTMDDIILLIEHILIKMIDDDSYDALALAMEFATHNIESPSMFQLIELSMKLSSHTLRLEYTNWRKNLSTAVKTSIADIESSISCHDVSVIIYSYVDTTWKMNSFLPTSFAILPLYEN